METIFVSDEKVQLVLLPDNELDRLLLNHLMGSGPVEIELIHQPVSILGKSVKDAIILRKKQHTQYATKTEELLGLPKT